MSQKDAVKVQESVACEDYFVRYGSDMPFDFNRTDYDTLKSASKTYDKLQLDEKVVWKELVHEPLDEEDAQYIVKNDEVKIIEILGMKVAIKQPS